MSSPRRSPRKRKRKRRPKESGAARTNDERDAVSSSVLEDENAALRADLAEARAKCAELEDWKRCMQATMTVVAEERRSRSAPVEPTATGWDDGRAAAFDDLYRTANPPVPAPAPAAVPAPAPVPAPVPAPALGALDDAWAALRALDDAKAACALASSPAPPLDAAFAGAVEAVGTLATSIVDRILCERSADYGVDPRASVRARPPTDADFFAVELLCARHPDGWPWAHRHLLVGRVWPALVGRRREWLRVAHDRDPRSDPGSRQDWSTAAATVRLAGSVARAAPPGAEGVGALRLRLLALAADAPPPSAPNRSGGAPRAVRDAAERAAALLAPLPTAARVSARAPPEEGAEPRALAPAQRRALQRAAEVLGRARAARPAAGAGTALRNP
jgi:hypothetical protein